MLANVCNSAIFLSSSKLTTNHAKGLSETQAPVSIVVIPANTKLCHT